MHKPTLGQFGINPGAFYKAEQFGDAAAHRLVADRLYDVLSQSPRCDQVLNEILRRNCVPVYANWDAGVMDLVDAEHEQANSEMLEAMTL